MSRKYPYPKLRWPIDVRFQKLDNQDVLVLQCPLGVSPEPLGLSPAVAPVLAKLEGSQSFEGIVQEFCERGLTEDILEELLTLLDTHYYLATPRFFAEEARIKEEFEEASSRPAALAGRSYPANRKLLEEELRGYLSNGAGPGSVLPMAGFMAPHIDYRRGGVCYGLTYSHLAQAKEDTYILIGTSHQYSTRMFHLTAKHFESPFGAVECDTLMTEKIASLYGTKRAYADQYLHKREHSLELQVPFLKLLRPDARIVPILVGSFHRMVASGKLPGDYEEYESFAGALTEVLREARSEGRNICILAGVDMAHVGKFFGDEGSLSAGFMLEVERRDREYLDALLSSDKKRLFSHIAEDGDKRRICGFPTMYTVLDIFDRLGTKTRPHLIDYRQAVDYRSDCAVTFAGMTFLT